jgi:hypothetical protein
VAPRPASRRASANDPLPVDLERDGPPVAGVDVEMQPVLDRLAFGYYLEPDPGAVAVRIDDEVRTQSQLVLGHPDVAPLPIPIGEAGRGRLEDVTQRGGPELGQRLRVGTVDHELEISSHRASQNWRGSSSTDCTAPVSKPMPAGRDGP